MKVKNLVIFSSLFVAALFLMSACTEEDVTGSRLLSMDKGTGEIGCGGNDANCPSDKYIGAFFCQNGNVTRNFKDYMCNTNQCVSSVSAVLIDICVYGVGETCVSGEAECQLVGNGTGKEVSIDRSPVFGDEEDFFQVLIIDSVGVANRPGTDDPNFAVWVYKSGDWRNFVWFDRWYGDQYLGSYRSNVSDWTGVDYSKGWYGVWKDEDGEYTHVGQNGDLYGTYQEVRQDTIPFNGEPPGGNTTHFECVGQFCIVVNGTGVDECLSDYDCQAGNLTCTDSDGGLNYDIKGYTYGINRFGNEYNYSDFCRNSFDGRVNEWYCDGDSFEAFIYNCTQGGYLGCEDGACYGNSSNFTG